jgi:HKD family nuclease
MANLQRKAKAADQMFSSLVAEMQHAVSIDTGVRFIKKESVPSWLSSTNG